MDLILKGGKVVTVNNKNEVAEAVGIRDGKIAVVGENEDVVQFATDKTKIIDLCGRLALPGFIESHMHMLNYGYTKNKLSLNSSGSIEELIELGKSFIVGKGIEEGKWLLGRGWNQDYFSVKRFPTKGDLDKISIEHPICYTRACGHVAVANSRAIDLVLKRYGSNIKENVDFTTGTFYEDGLKFIYGVIDSPEVEDIKLMLRDAGEDLIKNGITSVQTDDLDAMPDRDFNKVLEAYHELLDENRLPLRVYEQCLLPNIDMLRDFLGKGYKTGMGNTRFKIGPLKLLIDGSLGARTALMCEGYEDDKNAKGVSNYTKNELNEIVDLANLNDMQIAIHAIGDKAMYMALDSFKFARENKLREDERHGIVHCQITNQEIIDRMAKGKVLAYIQPIFIDYDLHIVEDRVGSEKAKKTYNWKNMINSGVKASGGSDAPVVSFNVLENIYSAVTRKDLNGFPEGGWLPEEKLTVDEAVRLFTINGAYASFEEDIKGSIEVGKLADIVVLSEDIYTIPEDRIKDVEIEMTIIHGEVVYSR